MLKCFFVLSFYCSSFVLAAQSFSGELKFKLSLRLIDEELIEKIEDTNLTISDSLSFHQYFIDDQMLVHLSFRPDSTLKYKELINDKEAIIEFSDGKVIDFYSSGIELLEFTLNRRTKKTKNIHGFECRKYEYISKTKETHLAAWIAESISFDKNLQCCDIPFFKNLIFPEGIALEKMVTHEHIAQYWRLEKIQLRDFPQDEILNIYDQQE